MSPSRLGRGQDGIPTLVDHHDRNTTARFCETAVPVSFWCKREWGTSSTILNRAIEVVSQHAELCERRLKIEYDLELDVCDVISLVVQYVAEYCKVGARIRPYRED